MAQDNYLWGRGALARPPKTVILRHNRALVLPYALAVRPSFVRDLIASNVILRDRLRTAISRRGCTGRTSVVVLCIGEPAGIETSGRGGCIVRSALLAWRPVPGGLAANAAGALLSASMSVAASTTASFFLNNTSVAPPSRPSLRPGHGHGAMPSVANRCTYSWRGRFSGR